MTSPDGINWTIRTSAADNSWYSVAYGNGLWVAVANSGTGNRVMTSDNGITWTSRTSADNTWSSVAYGNGLWVAVANSGIGNRVMTSPDGITWTSRTSAADIGWYAVAYGNGLWVAVANTGTENRVMTSPDGITWSARTSAADNGWNSVAYGNGLWVAVAYTGTGNRVMTSSNSVTIVGAGSSTITATQATDNNFTELSISGVLTILEQVNILRDFNKIAKQIGDTPFQINPPSTFRLGNFSYVSSNENVVTILGDTITIIGRGIANITATQEPNGIYNVISITTLCVVLDPNNPLELNNINLSNMNFVNGNLINMRILNSNLSNANLSAAYLYNTTIIDSSITYVNLVNANLTNASLENSNLYYSNVFNTVLSNTNLTGCKLIGINSGNIRGTPILPSNYLFQNGYIIGPGVILNNANLNYSNIFGANLTNLNLSTSTLEYIKSGNITGIPQLPNNYSIVNGYIVGRSVNLSNGNLANADLSNLNISNSNLYYANIYNANLSLTNMIGCNLNDITTGNIIGQPLLSFEYKVVQGYIIGPGVGLINANLSYANIFGVNLTNVNLISSQLEYITSGNIKGDPQLLTGYAILNGYIVGPNVLLHSANLINSNISNINLLFSNLYNANLYNSDLSSTNLSNCYIDGIISGNITGTPLLPNDYSMINSYIIGPDVNLNNANLIYANLSGVNLTNGNLYNANLTYVNLFGANLTNVNLNNVNLNFTNLSGANLTNVNLNNANLTYANLSSVNLTNGNLNNANLIYANLFGVNLTNGNLNNVNLNFTNLSGANLTNGNLNNANLTYANIFSANLTNVNLNNANLIYANLSGVNLINGNLNNTNLTFTNLSGVNLINGNLNNANLTYANLFGANLINGNLNNVNLTYVNLFGVNLTNVNLTTANLDYIVSGNILGNPQFKSGFGLFNGYILGSNVLLQQADLQGQTISNINLIGANLHSANLYGATFNNIIIDANTDLLNADLRNLVSGNLIGTTTKLSNNIQLINGSVKIVPNIANLVVSNKTYGDSTFYITDPVSDSLGAFSYVSSNISVATISINTTSLDFDGVNDYVTVPNIGTFSGITLEVWVYNTDSANGSRYSQLVSRGANGIGWDWALYLIPAIMGYPNNTLRWNAPGGIEINTNVIALNTWTHVAITCNNVETKIYINGALIKTQSTTNTMTNQTSSIMFGNDISFTRPYKGRLSDIRLWNVIRTASEISNNYQIKLNGNETGLVGNWKLTDGLPGNNNIGVTTAIDSSLSGKNGALSNFTLSGATSNWILGGPYTGLNLSSINIVGAGNALITGTQSVYTNYIQGNVYIDISVAKRVSTVGNLTMTPKLYTDGAFNIVTPITNSTGTFVYTSGNVSVASISGNTVTLNDIGESVIRATQLTDNNNFENFVEATLIVNVGGPTIQSITIPQKVYGDSPFTIGADPISNSSGAFTYTSSNLKIATISGKTITITGAGTATITATQAAKSPYTMGILEITFVVGLNGLTHTLISNKQLLTTLTSSAPTTGTYYIPPYINGYDVTELNTDLFKNKGGFTSIILPNSITTIYNNAFEGCVGLLSIQIPDSVTYLGQGVFNGCTALTSISIPINITNIRANCFKGCSFLQNVTLNQNITTVETNAFEGCVGLLSIQIPNSVTSLGQGVFNGCTALTSISIPINITNIKANCFNGCSSLKNVTLNNNLTIIETNAFLNCVALTHVNTTHNITTIGASAFQNCGLLNLFDLSQKITTLSTSVFENCQSLQISSIPGSITTIQSNAYKGCISIIGSISIPPNVITIQAGAFDGCTGITEFVFLNNYANTISSSFTNVTTVFKSSTIANGWTGISINTIAVSSTNSLSGLSIIGANLASKDLSNINISNVDLTGSNLSGVVFSPNTNLSGANFSNVNIFGANISQITFEPLQKLQLLKNTNNREITDIIIPNITGDVINSIINNVVSSNIADAVFDVIVPNANTVFTPSSKGTNGFYIPLFDGETININGVVCFSNINGIYNNQTGEKLDYIIINNRRFTLYTGSVIAVNNPLDTYLSGSVYMSDVLTSQNYKSKWNSSGNDINRTSGNVNIANNLQVSGLFRGNLVIPNKSDIISPVNGQLAYDNTGKIYIYTGQWQSVQLSP
jgi:uncharacterized protein YjbI with pentapeptide repeats